MIDENNPLASLRALLPDLRARVAALPRRARRGGADARAARPTRHGRVGRRRDPPRARPRASRLSAARGSGDVRRVVGADADRRGQDVRRHRAGAHVRAHGRRRARGDRQPVPRRARRRVVRRSAPRAGPHRRRHPAGHDAGGVAAPPTRAMSPTAPTASSASTSFATTCGCRIDTPSSAAARSPSSTRLTQCSSIRHGRRWCSAGRPRADHAVIIRADHVIAQLTIGEDIAVDLETNRCELSDTGIARCEDLSASPTCTPTRNTTGRSASPWRYGPGSARRDRDYVVTEGVVHVVDELTGRIAEGRNWSDGLQQAVEAKEDVAISHERRALARITVGSYFLGYRDLVGMSGTLEGAETELHDTFGLRVVAIPPNRAVIRRDEPDVTFADEQRERRRWPTMSSGGIRWGSRCSSAPSRSCSPPPSVMSSVAAACRTDC